jgi:hypothetical protein
MGPFSWESGCRSDFFRHFFGVHKRLVLHGKQKNMQIYFKECGAEG